jgi:hypothetical protein
MEIPEKPDALRAAFANALHMVAAHGRVVLVLDALNQIEDRDGAPDLIWLPPVIPANVRLVVSTLPGRSWNDLQKRAWPVLNVEPLSLPERETLIIDYLEQIIPKLSCLRLCQAPFVDLYGVQPRPVIIISHSGKPLFVKSLRKNWTADQIAEITPFEGEALRATGYVVGVQAAERRGRRAPLASAIPTTPLPSAPRRPRLIKPGAGIYSGTTLEFQHRRYEHYGSASQPVKPDPHPERHPAQPHSAGCRRRTRRPIPPPNSSVPHSSRL